MWEFRMHHIAPLNTNIRKPVRINPWWEMLLLTLLIGVWLLDGKSGISSRYIFAIVIYIYIYISSSYIIYIWSNCHILTVNSWGDSNLALTVLKWFVENTVSCFNVSLATMTVIQIWTSGQLSLCYVGEPCVFKLYLTINIRIHVHHWTALPNARQLLASFVIKQILWLFALLWF